MKLARILALTGLVLTVVPAGLFALGRLADAPMKACLVVGMILWFAAAPSWLKGGTD